MSQIKCNITVQAKRVQVFEYMMNPENWPVMLQNDIDVELRVVPKEMDVGNIYKMTMSRFGFSQPVEILIQDFQKNLSVTYKQINGLFSKWIHTQKFEDVEGGTLVTDVVEYQLPFGLFGHLVDDVFVRHDMKSVLEHRLENMYSHFKN